MSKITPGPWSLILDESGIHAKSIKGPSGNTIADVRFKNSHHDAPLIAAVPELLEALEKIVFVWEEIGKTPEACDGMASIAKAAIAKAKGAP